MNQEDVAFGAAIALISGGSSVLAGAIGLVFARAKGWIFGADKTSEAIDNDPEVNRQLQDLIDKKFEEENKKREFREILKQQETQGGAIQGIITGDSDV